MLFKQLTIETALVEQEVQRQKNCQHKLVTVPVFDFEHDEVYYLGVCQLCGYKEE